MVPGGRVSEDKASQDSAMDEDEAEAALWEEVGADSDLEQMVIPATAGMEVEV